MGDETLIALTGDLSLVAGDPIHGIFCICGVSDMYETASGRGPSITDGSSYEP